jgi:hypothetical protein
LSGFRELSTRTHPGRVSYGTLRSGWFGFVRKFGFGDLSPQSGRSCLTMLVWSMVSVHAGGAAVKSKAKAQGGRGGTETP